MPRDTPTLSERGPRESSRLPNRELTTEETLEVESDRWRRVVAAFLLGLEARPDRPGLRPWRGLLGGIGIALGIVLVVGVIGVATATLAASGAPKPSPTPPPAIASPR
jgi:hypothetical protein